MMVQNKNRHHRNIDIFDGIEFRYCKTGSTTALAYSIKQILYCPKHEIDKKTMGGHFKDGGFMQKQHDRISIETRKPFVVTL